MAAHAAEVRKACAIGLYGQGKIMIKRFVLFAILPAILGCASFPLGGFNHTAALIIGDPQEKVIADSMHIIGSPKNSGKVAGDTSDEQIAFNKYTFTDQFDLGLYFYKGTFIQAVLIDLKTPSSLPAVRDDFRSVQKGSPGPVGYMLVTNKKSASIKTLYKKDESPDSK